MPDDILPLYDETEETVKERLQDAINPPGTENTDAWVDVREGSAFSILTGPFVQEAARLWDAFSTEVVSACLPTLAWGEYLDAWAEAVEIERKPATKAVGEVTFTGKEGALIPAQVRLSAVQTDPNVAPPEYIVVGSGGQIQDGSFTAPIEAVEEGEQGNVGIGAVSLILDALEGVTGVTNAAPIFGGTEQEGDEELRERVLLKFAGSGAANIVWYRSKAMEQPGVGRVTVIPVGEGPGTVVVILMDRDGQPVSDTIVDDFQERMDPIPGQGAGEAPIDHTVIVVTPEIVEIDVVASITFDSGFSLDGSGGTIGLESSIRTAIEEYLNNLEAGEDVVRDHVMARIYTVEGVYKVDSLTVNDDTVDIPISTSPAEVAVLNELTLTET